MPRRICSSCGLMDFEQLSHSVVDMNLHAIKRLYSFIHDERSEYVLGQGHGRMTAFHYKETEKWWREWSVTDADYPSFMADRKPAFDKKELDALGVLREPIKKKVARLYSIKNDVSSPEGSYRDPYCLDLTRTSQHRLKSDYVVMNEILSWSARKEPDHTPRITNLRRLATEDMLHAAHICPFCTALSLWFFWTAAKRYGRSYSKRIAYFPFLKEFGCNEFYSVGPPNLVMNPSRRYFMDEAFSEWFYQQGLKFTFVHLQRMVQQWSMTLTELRKTGRPEGYFGSYRKNDGLHVKCATEVDNGVFYFYYKEEDLLVYLNGASVHATPKQCKSYHLTLAKCRYRGGDFCYELGKPEISYSTFRQLHAQFQRFLLSEIPA